MSAGHKTSPDLRRRLGERLRNWRQSRRWTQERLAEELEIRRDVVSHWECGRAAPCLTQLGRLATLGVDLTRLFTGFSAEHWSA